MKRFCWLLILAGVVAAGWFAFSLAVHVWRITDTSTKQERRVSDWFHSFSSGLLAIRAVGSLSNLIQFSTHRHD